MLYLEAPFHTIEGVVVFSDHADPLQWYYMPGAPRIAEVGGVPQVSLIKFKGLAGTGGFFNVDVDLAVDGDTLAEVSRVIKQIAQIDGDVRLAPLPVIDGSVRMMLFDAETPLPAPPGGGGGGAAPPADPDALRFVLKLTHPAKPALFADNRATFSVQLTQEGVTTLEKAMHGEVSPMGVVYSLDYLGLRPAYHVSTHVDWDLVQKHLEEHEEFSLPLIASTSIDTFVDELIESRVIVIEADTFVLEEDGNPVIARRDEAINDIKDMITDAFFEPTLDPIDAGDDVDTALKTTGRVLQAIASAGASEVHAFSKREVNAQRSERKRLDVAMSERTTVKRTVYPQGHLSGLFRHIGTGDPSRFVTEVDLDDPWFARRTLKVIGRAEWAADAVRSVEVTCDYDGDPRTALLTATEPTAELSWASRLNAGGMERDVTVHYKVNFGGIDGTERPLSLTSTDDTVVGDAVEIDPRALYSVSPVPVVALTYPWDRYPKVEVELTNHDAGHGIAQRDLVLLDAESTESSWPRFIRDDTAALAQYRITHRGADQRDLVGEWIDLTDERVVVRDPHPNGRVVDVVPGVDWTSVSRVFVDLSYHDAAHGIVEEMSMEFTKDAEATQQFRVRLADVTRREVGYTVTIMNADGSIVQVPPSVTEAKRIMVRADMLGHRVVHCRLAPGVDLVARKIRQVSVEFRYVDTAHGLDIADRAILTAADATGTFEFDYADANRTAYEYRVLTTFTNNLTRTKPWAPSDEADLVVAAG